ncbi:hypothetical protein QYF61_004300 [Mycteria americana]|uniref:Uncharacterized protein n=1 Tax=Mycteria americana TaxID=33587 RepID=A0AAN7NNY6_MYCAM|nr:hypothetical protein QYF61_004300 [Mycteria americana]
MPGEGELATVCTVQGSGDGRSQGQSGIPGLRCRAEKKLREGWAGCIPPPATSSIPENMFSASALGLSVDRQQKGRRLDGGALCLRSAVLNLQQPENCIDIGDFQRPKLIVDRSFIAIIRLLSVLSNLTLNVSRDGASTTSLGNLCQCFTTLIITNVFLISSLNLPSFSIKPLSLVLSQQALLKSCNKVSPEPFILQAEQPQLSQPVLMGEVFQPSDHFCGPPLDLFQQVHVFPVLRTPEVDAILQVGSHQNGVEGQNHLPQPADHASFDAAQDTVGVLGCEHTLLAHVQLFVQLFIHQHPQVLLGRAALHHFIPQPVLILGVAPTQAQDLALGLVEPHEIHMCPLLQLVQVPLDGILSLRCVNHTTQLGVICKCAEGMLGPTVYVTDEDIKLYWSQYRLLRDTTCH